LIRKALILVSLAAVVGPVWIANGQASRTAQGPSFDQLLASAEKARDENRDDDAIPLFRRALVEKPDSEECLWYLGSTLYAKEQYAEALDVLRQFMTIRPDAGPGWALLGMSELQLREYPRALDHLQRAISQSLGDRKELMREVYYDSAILLARLERYDDSLDMLQKLLSSGDSDPLLEAAGLAGLRLPYLPAEIPPDQRQLIRSVGEAVLAVQTQHYEQADLELNRLVEAYPREPGVHFLRGAYLAQLHPQEATPEFERELEISPSHVLARVRLAEQLVTDGKYERALTLAQQAIQLDPKRASAHMIAGEALIAKGDAAEGTNELETARDMDPTATRIHWDLLRAYAAAGRKEDADREKKEIETILHGDSPNRPRSLGDAPHDSSGTN
jgi:tetratricopeptide (TPR) repeat protein